MKELINIQSRLKTPKNQYNSYGKYNYRSCEDILLAVKPLLLEYGCILTISDDIVMVGNRIYVKATATISNEKGEYITTSAFAREAEKGKNGMDDAQTTGASSSYARKYALNGLFCIDDTKDADSTNTHKEEKVEEDVDMFEVAMADLKRAKTSEEVASVWNNFPTLKSNVEFKDAVSKKGSRLKQAV